MLSECPPYYYDLGGYHNIMPVNGWQAGASFQSLNM